MIVSAVKEFVFFEELYRSEYKKMLACAMSRLRDLQAAEDIVQDTFAVACKKKNELMSNPNPRAWLYVVLRNKIMHEYRAKSRFMVVWQKLETAAAQASLETDDSWKEVLEGLPKDDYELLKLIYVDGYSNREAAEKMGITYDACRKAVQRAKTKVKKNYDP